MSDSRKERRRYPRHYAVIADYRLIGQGPMKVTQVKNISAVGICLILYEGISIGTGLELEIYLPDGAPALLAKGKVVWVKEFKLESELKTRFDVGISFYEINESDAARISRYVSSLSGGNDKE